MDYFTRIATPAGTKESDPHITVMELTRGRLVSGELIFNSSCDCKHHIIFCISTFRLAPFNQDANYLGDDMTVHISFDQDFHKQPHRLHILSWNDDAQSMVHALCSLHFDPFSKPRSTKSFEDFSKTLVPGYMKGVERNAKPTENTQTFTL